MINKFIRKYHLFIYALLALVLFAGYYSSVVNRDYQSLVASHTRSFHQLQVELESTLRFNAEDIEERGVSEKWENLKGSKDVNIHIYRNDSLKYWNTNQLPIIRFAEIHFPAEGVLHLQNGWYYAKIKEIDDYLICASFLIKQDFSYQNRDLVNNFNERLALPFDASVGIGEDHGISVHGKNKDYLYSLIPNDIQGISYLNSILLFLLLLSVIVLFLIALSRFALIGKKAVLIPIAILLFRVASLYFNWFSIMDGTLSYDPALYGTNEWLPNFFEYSLNVILIIYFLSVVKSYLPSFKVNKINQALSVGLFIGALFFWSLILYFTQSLIENSSISLVVNKLFELNFYSIFAITSIGVLFYAFFKFLVGVVNFSKTQGVKATQLAVIAFIAGCIYFFYEVQFNNQILLEAIFPLIFYGLAIYIVYKDENLKQLGTGLILLFVFSGVLSVSISKLNSRKEKIERAFYANQLATEKDINTEVEYKLISEKLQKDNFIKKLIDSKFEISGSSFQENIERRFFSGYWERYEMKFSLFTDEFVPLVYKRTTSKENYFELQAIVQYSGTPSKVDSSIFFINNYKGQYSYIIRQEIVSNSGEKGILFCTLKSKKIPEQIGFPRLLISSKANVMESLENYSIGKFHSDRLITKYGDFNYPSFYPIMLPEKFKGKGFFDYGEYNHYFLKKSDNNVVVLSVKNEKWIDTITAFSYLFSFYGLLLLPLILRINTNKSYRKAFSLALKIQLVLISLVFLSLLAFGWGSGVFVSSQYKQYTNDVISEKLNSVETEVRAKLGDYSSLSIDENGDYMQYILQKFSKVFFTDINLYSNDGYLLATSRPKVFNVGLISEQMNPQAYKKLQFEQKSEFVQREDIGGLTYSSAYQPFYNKKGEQLAFINLQHFGQQREFENQIQKFLVAIINVFILLLAISMILAIFVSSWLTAPLRILQESFSNVDFGKLNERISYDKEDEIGALVKDYNHKLDELEFTAQQLAKSERESAWREMAKQVAHEIKNPLTPMKLSVQQLLRVYNPEDPKSEEKLKKVANSIVEQIDALTKIANEFSNFAKMPNPSEEQLDLLKIVKGVKEFFTVDGHIKIYISSEQENIFVKADKDQMIRVFNNLLKNAMQAIPAEKEGVIDVLFEIKSHQVIISVKDNGVGIDASKINKIFVPYFTTKSTGTGLGLAMVKQIIENHNGSISFATEETKGTVFKITLPLAE